MKKMIILASLVSMTALANAQQVGRVISSTPLIQTVAVPQQTCSQTYVSEPAYNANGGGALLGAIAGGLIGSVVGGGGHRGYYGGYYGRNNGAIALGAVSGALIGSQVNSGGGYVSRPVQNCYTQNSYQNVITGYEVVYELNGGTYTTQTSTPPGSYISVGNNYSNYTPPTYYQPAPVYTSPVYAAPPVYYVPPPVYYRPYHHYRGW